MNPLSPQPTPHYQDVPNMLLAKDSPTRKHFLAFLCYSVMALPILFIFSVGIITTSFCLGPLVLLLLPLLIPIYLFLRKLITLQLQKTYFTQGFYPPEAL
ncbi:hypothetical protein [Chlamydia gallinacea]|nr:hypothetical protein [Chlamydia gallinacea]